MLEIRRVCFGSVSKYIEVPGLVGIRSVAYKNFIESGRMLNLIFKFEVFLIREYFFS